ncbi:MAG: tetratricopeptide repeat protein [Chloracidobacterium sp.]|nr:tetratricopeptide repeat protein [Chloracidobacterium sp.]
MKNPRIFVLAAILLLSFSVSANAKDEWIQVKSKNFFLIGNASEKDIRKVGTRLEQFRETFRLLFSKMNLTSSTPTNVVVFKSSGSYKNFKPKRDDGKIDEFIAGFFQPGEDVNYITLSTEGEDAQTYSVIFHEYVHFIVNTNFGKSEVPAWFNEGLAEYYSTFEIEQDQKVKLGLPKQNHLELLQQSKLMPLSTLFNISNAQLLQTGGHSRSIFYAQSWALIHYMMQNGKSAGLGTFLADLARNVPPEKAFQDAFQTGYAQMETELKKYVGQSRYQYQIYEFKTKMTFDTDMRMSPLTEAESNAYLGDLLFHNHRVDDAEPYLLTSLKLDPNSSIANTTLGMVKLKQRKFADARIYLEKAIAGDAKNHAALYQYALLLSREGRDEFGYVQRFDKDVVAKIREALRKAIALNPAFTESYELLAFVDMVNNEELDAAVSLMKTALKYQPGNQRYALRMAELYVRQNKFAEAATIFEKIARTADNPEVKSRADEMISQMEQRKAIAEQNEAERKRYEAALAAGSSGGPRVLRRVETGTAPTEAEKAKMIEEERMRSINSSLRKTLNGETRVNGRIQKIDCKKRPLTYTIKTATETFNVTSVDFASLDLHALDQATQMAEVGCDADLSAFNALLTYKTTATPKSTARGELVAIEFVPADFRLMTEEEMRTGSYVIYEQDGPPNLTTGTGPPKEIPNPGNVEDGRKAAMMQGLRNAVQKPGDGQKREMGFLDKIECSSKAIYFHLRTGTQTYKLSSTQGQPPKISLYTPDLQGIQFGCGIKPIEFPVVFIYNDKPDAKAKTAGDIVSLEFVPMSFTFAREQ